MFVGGGEGWGAVHCYEVENSSDLAFVHVLLYIMSDHNTIYAGVYHKNSKH